MRDGTILVVIIGGALLALWYLSYQQTVTYRNLPLGTQIQNIGQGVVNSWLDQFRSYIGGPPGIPAPGYEWRQGFGGQWTQVPIGSQVLF